MGLILVFTAIMAMVGHSELRTVKACKAENFKPKACERYKAQFAKHHAGQK